MDREIKVAELAKIWGISVNATWSRIRKERLSTIKKLENGKEITFVIVSEDILKKYVVNNVNEVVNNGDYEELLIDDNHNEVEKIDLADTLIKFSQEVNNQIINLNNNYNQQLMKYNDELITYKSKTLLLEDIQGREGLYLQQIKNVESEKNKILKWLVAAIVVLSILFVTSLVYIIYLTNHPKIIETQKVVEKVIEKPVPIKKR